MAFRFRKRIKLGKGLSVNLSKSGVSTSIGGKGFTYNTRGRVTVSAPGTGLSYVATAKKGRSQSPTEESTAAQNFTCGCLTFAFLLISGLIFPPLLLAYLLIFVIWVSGQVYMEKASRDYAKKIARKSVAAPGASVDSSEGKDIDQPESITSLNGGGESSASQAQPYVLVEPLEGQEAKENYHPRTPPDSKYPDYKVDYFGESGQHSQRRITIIEDQDTALYCHCHLRKSRRTFLVSRIQKATNCRTGEIVTDIKADMAASLEDTVWGTLMRMSSDLYPPMGVLLCLGKGDRRLMKGERSILIATFQVLCADERATAKLVSDELDCLTVPSRTSFRRLLSALKAHDPGVKSLVLESSEKLFSTRKQLNPVEKEGLEAVQKALTSKS